MSSTNPTTSTEVKTSDDSSAAAEPVDTTSLLSSILHVAFRSVLFIAGMIILLQILVFAAEHYNAWEFERDTEPRYNIPLMDSTGFAPTVAPTAHPGVTNSTQVSTAGDSTARPLAEFTTQLMGICKAQLSDARRAVLSQQIARIAEKYLVSRERQEAFVYLICVESKFKQDAKSSVGATGLTQIMPKYATAFSEGCGLGKLDAGDLVDTEMNLTLGACLFSQLLNRFEGNIGLALAGYNSGPDSPTTKKLGQLQEGHPETSGYLAKFLVLSESYKVQEAGGK